MLWLFLIYKEENTGEAPFSSPPVCIWFISILHLSVSVVLLLEKQFEVLHNECNSENAFEECKTSFLKIWLIPIANCVYTWVSHWKGWIWKWTEMIFLHFLWYCSIYDVMHPTIQEAMIAWYYMDGNRKGSQVVHTRNWWTCLTQCGFSNKTFQWIWTWLHLLSIWVFTLPKPPAQRQDTHLTETSVSMVCLCKITLCSWPDVGKGKLFQSEEKEKISYM